MREWSKQWQYVLLAGSGLLVVAALAVSHLGASEPPPITFEAASRLPPGVPIRVHVTGEVAQPGVYQLAEGDRVIDAVNMAGGFANGADAEALNQARKLRDGEQLVVPSRVGSSRTAAAQAPSARSARQSQHSDGEGAGPTPGHRRGPFAAHRRLSIG